MNPTKIIQFEIVQPWQGLGEQCLFGRGDNGIIYAWSPQEKKWVPQTTNIFEVA